MAFYWSEQLERLKNLKNLPWPLFRSRSIYAYDQRPNPSLYAVFLYTVGYLVVPGLFVIVRLYELERIGIIWLIDISDPRPHTMVIILYLQHRTKSYCSKDTISVADPNPDPPDPHVFEPAGSESISQRYGSGSVSGSFYHHAKIVRKTLISTILWLFLTFYLWKMM